MPDDLFDLNNYRPLPAAYQEDSSGHPLLTIPRDCQKCNLRCGASVSPAAPDDLTQVKLIVISDYPGAYETQTGIPQTPRPWARQKETHGENSGMWIRSFISEWLGLDHVHQVLYTNALGCDPGFQQRNTPVNDTQIKLCVTYLREQFDRLDQDAPSAPVLLLGKWAVKAAQRLDPHFPKEDLSHLLRRKLRLNGRVVSVALNPAWSAKVNLRVETAVQVKRKKSHLEVVQTRPFFSKPRRGTELYKCLEDLREVIEHFNHKQLN